jgi:hypothetical protein
MADPKFAGNILSRREILGEEPKKLTVKEEANKIFKQISYDKYEWKKFKVYEGNDEEQWDKTKNFFKSILGREPKGKALPKKNDEGLYTCTATKLKGVQYVKDINPHKTTKWSNFHLLKQNVLKYARIFVGYEDMNDSTEYTIYVKYTILTDTPDNIKFLSKYLDLKRK